MAGNLHTLIRDLQRRKARERRGLVVAEGRRIVEDALGSGGAVRAILAADDVAGGTAAPLLAEARKRGITSEVAPRKAFDALADTETPSGVLAVVAWEPLALEEVRLESGARRLVLVLDAVQDPGNVGTMIRTAHALGADLTVALDGTADVRSPKVVRAAMGSLFRHRVAQADWRGFADFGARCGLANWLAAPDGDPVDRALDDAAGPIPGPKAGGVALVVGSEGRGVREEWRGLEHRRVAIPMRQGAESLNAAVAAGILLYELARAGR